MKVYVLMSQVGSMRFVHGVLSNEEKAQEWEKEMNEDETVEGYYSYREYELDKE